MNPIKTMVVAIRVLAVRPWLWPTALRQLRNFAPDGWWRRAPFLPIPDRALLEFRGTTQYGDPNHAADADDLLAWLEWCRRGAPGGVTGRFHVEHVTADAATLHDFRPPRHPPDACRRRGHGTSPRARFDPTRHPCRSGQGRCRRVRDRPTAERGGSVWLAPGAQVWVDVWLPAGDPWWDDDVARAAVPVGEAWRSALEVSVSVTASTFTTGGRVPAVVGARLLRRHRPGRGPRR